MNKFLENLRNISDANRLLRYALISCLVATAILNITIFIYCFSVVSEQQKKIYVLTKDGKAISAELLNVEDKRDIEAISLARNFTYLFFEIDKWNFEQKVKNSFQLGGNCLVELYSKFSNDEWYKKITQYNISQTVTIEKIYTESKVSPYSVTCDFKVRISSEVSKEPKFYEISMNLTIEDKKGSSIRTESNPYAMMITSVDITKFNEISDTN